MTKRTISLSVLVVFAMVALTACGGVAQTAGSAPVLSSPTQAASAPVQESVPSGASGDLLAVYQGTLENLYTTVSPSVVNIQVVMKVAASDTTNSQIPGFPFFNQPQGQDQSPQQYQSA